MKIGIPEIINFLVSGITTAGFVWYYMKCRDLKNEIKWLREMRKEEGFDFIPVVKIKKKNER